MALLTTQHMHTACSHQATVVTDQHLSECAVHGCVSSSQPDMVVTDLQVAMHLQLGLRSL